jgi:hypothetical protein
MAWADLGGAEAPQTISTTSDGGAAVTLPDNAVGLYSMRQSALPAPLRWPTGGADERE